MNGYWITFTDGSSGYCNGFNEPYAKRTAEKLTGKTVKEIAPLPYPAEPIIWQFEDPVYGKCPPFCYSPNKCKGRTSCPQNYACSE